MSRLTLAYQIPRGGSSERRRVPASGWERWAERLLTLHVPGRLRAQFRQLLLRINQCAPEFAGMSDADLQAEIPRLREQLARSRWELPTIAAGFALIREQAGRRLGQRHYDVQLLGGWILLNGLVAEMETGEGKTLTATLPACIMALAGVPVHVVTVNDYLARRDADWMLPLYQAFGLSVGVIVHGMNLLERQQAYACDVTYCTNKELVFDYLKDRLASGDKPGNIQAHIRQLGRSRHDGQLLRGLRFAIVDEADSVLIDEARTPLVISGQGDSAYEGQVYCQAVELAGQLREGGDFSLGGASQPVVLTPAGQLRLAQLVDGLDAIWTGRRRREELVVQALTALHLFRRDRDYLINNGRVQIVDEFTGRILSDRSWERGLHQMVEAKEGCRLTAQKDTLARISYQRFFRRYHLLAGMTGTAGEVAGELWTVYGLRVIRVPTNRPARRQLLPCRLSRRRDEKWQAVVARIAEVHATGRPILVGTRSVEASEYLSGMLTAQGLAHQVLNARQDQDEAEIVSQAGALGRITVATNMAGRGTDIRLGAGVAELGGVHVMATEPHAARRIDRQLFGRCGRQGDPGSCELFASFEDEIVLSLCGDGRPLAALAPSLAHDGGAGRYGRLLLQLAQRRIERRHCEMRAELMQFDEMMEQTLAFSGRGE